MKDDELFEDESGSEGKGSKKTKKSTKSTSSNQQKSSQEFDLMSQSIGLVWAVGLIVVAFVVGFFVRGLFLPMGTTGSSTQAPPITEEQMQSGEMPAGHPSVGGEMPMEVPSMAETTPASVGEAEVGTETTATP